MACLRAQDVTPVTMQRHSLLRASCFRCGSLRSQPSCRSMNVPATAVGAAPDSTLPLPIPLPRDTQAHCQQSLQMLYPRSPIRKLLGLRQQGCVVWPACSVKFHQVPMPMEPEGQDPAYTFSKGR